jgi:ubiquinone/menaquinone biosynthesis C-methylase UbiE
MTETTDRHPAPRTTGLLIHAAARYDLLVWLLTLGRERALRDKILSFINLKPGEAVLDVRDARESREEGEQGQA